MPLLDHRGFNVALLHRGCRVVCLAFIAGLVACRSPTDGERFTTGALLVGRVTNSEGSGVAGAVVGGYSVAGDCQSNLVLATGSPTEVLSLPDGSFRQLVVGGLSPGRYCMKGRVIRLSGTRPDTFPFEAGMVEFRYRAPYDSVIAVKSIP